LRVGFEARAVSRPIFRKFTTMSRLTTRFPATLLVSVTLLAANGARADSVSDVRARGKAAATPADAVDASRALRRAGLQMEAINTVQRAFGKARGDDALGDLRLELARSYIDQRKQKLALRECEQLHKLSPYKEQLCQAEAQLLTRRGSAALPAAEMALAAQPGDYDALVAKGRALTQLGKPGDADAVLHEAQKRAPNRPEAYRYLGELLIAQGKPGDAVSVLRDARKVAPDDPDVLQLLASVLPADKEARDAAEHALTIRPSFPDAEARLGQVLLALGDLDGAERHLQSALKAVPRQADWQAALGEVQIAKKQPDLALKSAEQALKVVGNHGPAKFVEAKALAQKGDIDMAIEAFQAAYGFSRTDPSVLVEAARACVRANRPTTAKAFADRATEDFPKAAASWETEGDVAVAMKDVAFAKQAYGKALAGEGPADKDAIRRKLAALK
jgi:tetratricopeptide (TPR) repeat protein